MYILKFKMTTKNQIWVFSVRVSDGTSLSNWVNSTTLTINNVAPTAENVTINSTDFLNRTNGTLQGFFSFADIDGDTLSANETKW